MRPIDADALWTYIANNSACYHDCCPRASGKKGVLACIDEQPTIEPEVRHGQWQYDLPNAIFVCSECLMMYRDNPNFCPRCGAKMDGGEDDG